jgi:hypothetical protein
MAAPKLNAEFIVKIALKNDRGEVVGEKEFVTYPGLLALAHELGLEEIHTTIIQMPTDANGQTVVIRAVAKGKPGLYTGIGDASPLNTNRKVARHLIRVAETRAKARALRDLCNINLVALEELGGDEDLDDERREAPATSIGRHHTPQGAANGQPRRTVPATDPQRRALFRRAYELGYEGRDAAGFLAQRLGVDIERATREQASKLLDELAAEERRGRANGGDHAAE